MELELIIKLQNMTQIHLDQHLYSVQVELAGPQTR